jgi:tRNA threonylcarbamoyladenosine biosynthesis protein TsaB
MLILGIDTSTLQSGVALVEGDGRVRAVRRARVTTHSEGLLVLVEEVLAEAQVAAPALEAIACTGGPGSFTGLRIGLSTAKGLCLALGRPLVLVSSLQALAARAPSGVTAVACLDALKGEVYAGVYRVGAPGEEPVLVGAEEVLAPERVAERLAALAVDGLVHLLGDAVVRWPVLRVPGVIADDTGAPDPVDLARLGALLRARGHADDLAAAAPRYIRPSEAEIMAARRSEGGAG